MKPVTAERYLALCARKGIVLSTFFARNLELILSQAEVRELTGINHSRKTVGALFPGVGRSDPDAEHRFNRPVTALPYKKIDEIHRTVQDDATFRAKVMESIAPEIVDLPEIQKVTYEMIWYKVFSDHGEPFIPAEVLSFLLRVDFPELGTGKSLGDYHAIPETDVWMRVLQDPFRIGERDFQACFGLAKDGTRRVELIAFDPDQGFIPTEHFYYRC